MGVSACKTFPKPDTTLPSDQWPNRVDQVHRQVWWAASVAASKLDLSKDAKPIDGRIGGTTADLGAVTTQDGQRAEVFFAFKCPESNQEIDPNGAQQFFVVANGKTYVPKDQPGGELTGFPFKNPELEPLGELRSWLGV